MDDVLYLIHFEITTYFEFKLHYCVPSQIFNEYPESIPKTILKIETYSSYFHINHNMSVIKSWKTKEYAEFKFKTSLIIWIYSILLE